MSYVAICGVETSIIDHLTETTREVGETSNAFDGTLVKSRQSVKRDLDFELNYYTQAEAFAWDTLIRGLGEHWSFTSSLYSAKGKVPSTVTGCSLDGSEYKHSANGLAVTAGNTFAPASVYSTSLGCTVMFWYEVTAGAGFTHYIVTEDSGGNNNYWTSGATKTSGTPAPTGLTVAMASGTVTLTMAGATRYVDDLVVLPCVVPDSWPAQLYALCNAQAFSDLPRLYVAGDALVEGSRTMLGEVERSSFASVVLSGTRYTTARRMAVRLSQV